MSFARSNRTYVYAETWRLPNLFADLQTEQPFSKRDLLNSLHIYSAARCHEPRDIVYSLLSIGKFEPGAGANFGANYSTTPKAVYKTLAKHYISCGRALEVVLLASCRRSRSGEKKAELPSWVPDWRLPVRYDSEHHKSAVESRLQRNITEERFHGLFPKIKGDLVKAWIEPASPRHLSVKGFLTLVCSQTGEEDKACGELCAICQQQVITLFTDVWCLIPGKGLFYLPAVDLVCVLRLDLSKDAEASNDGFEVLSCFDGRKMSLRDKVLRLQGIAETKISIC